MHAFLITGGNLKLRRDWINDKINQWKVAPFDKRELVVEEPSIGISHIRQFRHGLMTGPPVAIIWQAERMTTEAQNALLKILEEPPKNTRILLESSSVDSLLPTVVSRCHLTRLGREDAFSKSDQDDWLKTWSTLSTLNAGKALEMMDTIATDRQHAQNWVQCGIEALSKELNQGHGKDALLAAIAIRRLYTANIQLEANVTPKLVLDHVVLE